MKQSHSLLLFVFIFLIGMFFRFYLLGMVPQSLNWDEVSWGYNAYSIATTGKDEYGSAFPLSFKAFGDYKQPVYVYLDALPTLFWGLTAFAVRFPSALFGSLTVISVFFLTFELFYRHRYRQFLCLTVMLLFAVSPWSIQFSRVAYEANIGVFFTITGAYFFLRGIREKRPWLLGLATIVLSLSCYTYHSQKIFMPLFFLVMVFCARAYFLKHRKILVVLLLLFAVVNSFWIADMRTTARGRSVLFTSNDKDILAESSQLLLADAQHHDILGLIPHNRRTLIVKKYTQNYLSHFDPNFLFLEGDNPRHHAPFMGVLYLLSLPFILIGMIGLVKSDKQSALLIFLWLLLAPVASALALGAPNASRSMVFLPTWQIFAGYGIMQTVFSCKGRKKINAALAVIMFFYVLQVIFYAHLYFLHTDTEFASDWQYGYKEVVSYVAAHRGEYQKVIVSNTYPLDQSYIFFLYYLRYPPEQYQQDVQQYLTKGDIRGFDGYEFRPLGVNNGNYEANILYVTAGNERLPVQAKTLYEVHYQNGDPAFRVFTFSVL